MPALTIAEQPQVLSMAAFADAMTSYIGTATAEVVHEGQLESDKLEWLNVPLEDRLAVANFIRNNVDWFTLVNSFIYQSQTRNRWPYNSDTQVKAVAVAFATIARELSRLHGVDGMEQ